MLDNGVVRVSVDLDIGTYSIEADSERLVDCALAVDVDSSDSISSRGGADHATINVPGGMAHVLSWQGEHEPSLVVEITVLDDRPEVSVVASVRNDTKAPLRVAAMRVLDSGRVDIGAPAESLRFYKHGWQSWSPTMVLDCAGEDHDVGPPVIAPRTRPERRDGRFLSELMSVVATPDGSRGVLAGFVTAADQVSQVWFDRDGASLTAASYPDGVTLDPGDQMSSEMLMIDVSGTAFEALARYGDELGRRMDATVSETVASGWCSWYQYFTKVTENDIVANLKELAAHKDVLPIDYVQIDDGYQAEIGDWLTMNEKFPHGMRWLVDRIHGEGYKAGLWVAPFLMGAKSALFKEHPEWAVQHSPGVPSIATQNWGQDCYAIDLTRPDVVEWLGIVFRTVSEDWDFDYVKIDFIYAGAVDGIRHDPNVTRAQAYRRGLQAIRDAVGKKFILGCGNPMGPSIGLVDGARIGPDVAPYWHPYEFEARRARSPFSEPATINGIRNTLTRYWMHDRLWQNDPDCLMVRASDTALSGDEVRCLATVIGLTGGMVLDSDDMALVSDERREIISMLLPVYGVSAVPEDLFAAEMPERLVLDLNSHEMIAALNWDDALDTRTIALPKNESHVFDVWSQQYLGVYRDAIELEVPPHGSRLLSVREKRDIPRVVGTSFHLLQGALECGGDWENGRLTLELIPVAKKRGSIFLFVPSELGEPRSSEVEITSHGNNIYAINVELREPRTIVIEFAS